MIDSLPWRGDGVWTRSRNYEGMVAANLIGKGGTSTANGVDRRYWPKVGTESVFVSRHPFFSFLLSLVFFLGTYMSDGR